MARSGSPAVMSFLTQLEWYVGFAERTITMTIEDLLIVCRSGTECEAMGLSRSRPRTRTACRLPWTPPKNTSFTENASAF